MQHKILTLQFEGIFHKVLSFKGKQMEITYILSVINFYFFEPEFKLITQFDHHTNHINVVGSG